VRWGKIVGILALLIGGMGTVLGVELALRPLFYPSLAVSSIAAFTLANDAASVAKWNTTETPDHTLQRLLDTVVFGLLLAGFLIVKQHSRGVPDSVYWIVALSTGAIVLRILLKPSLVVLGQTILLSFLLRVSTWFSAPVIGKDSRLHQALISNIVQTNDLIPASVTYYHYYPVSHITGAEVALIGWVDAKIASFFAFTGASIIGIAIVYFLTERMVGGSARPSQGALFASLFVATAPSHISRSGLPIAQTVGLGLVPLVLYAAYRSNDIRFRLLAVFSTLPLVITHNLTPTLLVTLLLVVTIADEIFKRVGGITGNVPQFKGSLFAIGLLSTFYYYIVIEYFGLQISRASRVFLGGQSIATDVSSSQFASTAHFTLLDPLLHSGSGLYVVASAFVVVLIGEADSIQDGEIPYREYAWYAGAGVIFAVSGAAIAAGGSELTFRALPFLMLVASLVVGSACQKLDTGAIGRLAIVLMLLVSPMLAVVAAENGVRNPSVSPTNRVQDVPVDMQSNELAATRFATNRLAKTRMDRYVFSSVVLKSLGEREVDGQTNGGDILSRIDNLGATGDMTRNTLNNCSAATLYRERYRNFPGLTPPQNRSAIYDSGGGRLYVC
jgi:hypothetical protein